MRAICPAHLSFLCLGYDEVLSGYEPGQMVEG